MSRSRLCDYSDAYILVKGTISITAQAGDNPNNGERVVVFKHCAPFIDCVSEINSAELDYIKDIDIVVPWDTYQNIAITIQKHQEVYGNTIEINQL